MIDLGSQQEVEPGQPVIDGIGVVGQVTRVYPWLSEVTLITDKNHLVPVLNTRNGLRAVLSGTGNDGALELKFVPLNADFEIGDQLVTSGIDGIYPRACRSLEVANVERNAASFSRHRVQAPRRGNHHNRCWSCSPTTAHYRPASESRCSTQEIGAGR